MNKGCLNVIWHFPLFGFLCSLVFAIAGVIWCCTIIFYPIGLGYFRIAKYLLSPFTSALVSQKDLELVRNDNDGNSFHTSYSKIIGILFIPFGILSAIGAIFHVIYCCLSIIGIPCAYVWFNALPAFFNPTDKICVPKEVADEIDRLKSGAKLSAFKGESPAVQRVSESSSVVSRAEGTAFASANASTLKSEISLKDQVRSYDNEQLKSIENNAVMYNASLVAMCVKELAIRQASEGLMPQVTEFSDEKLNEILSKPTLYSDEIIYCCEKVYKERSFIKEQQRKLKQEQERLRLQRLEQEQREEKLAKWRKVRPYVFVVAAISIILIVVCSINSYHRKQEQIALEQAQLAAKKAEEEQMVRDQIVAEARQKMAEDNAKKAAAEKARIEAEQKRERERIAAENAQKEREKILSDPEYRRQIGAYLVGETIPQMHDGVVISVDNTYKHGTVVVKRKVVGFRNELIAWVESLGEGWRMLGTEEAQIIYKNKELCDRFYFLNNYIWQKEANQNYYYVHIYYEGRDRTYSSNPDIIGYGYAVKDF